jgi:hypothetical protein
VTIAKKVTNTDTEDDAKKSMFIIAIDILFTILSSHGVGCSTSKHNLKIYKVDPNKLAEERELMETAKVKMNTAHSQQELFSTD